MMMCPSNLYRMKSYEFLILIESNNTKKEKNMYRVIMVSGKHYAISPTLSSIFALLHCIFAGRPLSLFPAGFPPECLRNYPVSQQPTSPLTLCQPLIPRISPCQSPPFASFSIPSASSSFCLSRHPRQTAALRISLKRC